MKCNPLRWLWALPVIALIWWLAQQAERGTVEADLKARTMASLTSVGQAWATTGFNGRDGWIRGKAFDEADQTRAVEAVRNTWGVRVVENLTALADAEKDYIWIATREGRGIVLSGFVSRERERSAVLTAIRTAIPGTEVIDQMQIARGAPDREVWLDGIGFAARQLARLSPGSRVTLNGLRLTVEGEAVDLAALKTIKGALAGRLPTGVSLAAERVRAPVISPYTWQARLTRNQIELSGYTPNEAVRDALLARAKAMLETSTIVDRMVVAEGAPQRWSEATTTLLVSLARLQSGQAALSNTTGTFVGETVKEEDARAISRYIRERSPQGYDIKPEIKFRDPEIPLQQPFETTVTTDAKSVSVTGFVADEAQRKALLELVSTHFQGRRVVGRLRYARGQPENWRACMQAGVEGLSALVSGTASLVDRELKVTGVTDDEDVAANLPGVVRAAANRACQDEVVVTLNAPPEPDFEWQARRTAREVIFDGQVTDSTAKTSLMEAARKLFPGLTITDHTRVAPARSSKWPRVAHTGLAMLARLRAGEVKLSRQVLQVSGIAPDTTVVTAITNQLRDGLARGYRGEENIVIRSDAMVWAEQEARRKAEADIRRAADAQSQREADERRKRQEAEADAIRRQAAAESEARRRQQAADDESRRRAEADAQARRQRAEAEAEERRRQAEAEARRRQIEADERRRQVEADERRRQAEAAARQTPAVREQRVKEADRCQNELNRAAAAGIIRFARASADIENASHGTLDALVRVARTCPDYKIEVGGHTDAEGTDERNQRLSDRRANAVVDYLVQAGIQRPRISAVGYGATRPIADNETAEGRARNRRIEFKVSPD